MIDFSRLRSAPLAGERQIGRQRRAFVAALFLDDLDEKHLAALDHVLDLVPAAQVLALAPKLVGGGFVDRRAIGTGTALLGLDLAFFRLNLVSRLVGVIPIVAVVGVVAIVELGGTQPLLFGGVLGLLAQQGFAIGLGYLVVIGMDFAEGEKAVAVAAIVDERRLKRRFDPRNLG